MTSLAEPHATLVYLNTACTRDWPRVEQEFERVVTCSPDCTAGGSHTGPFPVAAYHGRVPEVLR